MKLHVAIDNRFLLHEGTLYDTYTQDQAFWQDYLEVFDEVVVVGRARRVEELPDGAHRSGGEGISFEPVPYWAGALDWLRTRGSVRRRLRDIAGDVDAAVLRVPGMVGTYLGQALRELDVPYAVEVTQDPEGTYPRLGPLGSVVDAHLQRLLAECVEGAAAASYVTTSTLQERYPAPRAEVKTHYSSIRLPADRIVTSPRAWTEAPSPLTVIHVGGMYDGRKGQDLLLEAVARCRNEDRDVRCVLVGGGPMRDDLERQAARLGIDGACRFVGNVPEDEVFDRLDGADLFVLPSESEGLPRSLIEAMARGLPALATPVGGVPEVLPEEALVPADAEVIAGRIGELVDDPETLTAMAKRNLETARRFTDDDLRQRRVEFYRQYRRIAEAR